MGKQATVSPIRERLIVLQHEGMNCDVLPVRDVDDNRILAGNGEFSVPLKDVRQFISPEGRVYVLAAPDWYIDETRHLAEVEMSAVIKQAVAYQRPGSALKSGGGFLRFLPWILAVAAILLVIIFKG